MVISAELKERRAQQAREAGKLGGRPRGSKNKATLEREAVLKGMQQRIMRSVDLLLDSQFTLARGQTFLYKIEKYYDTVTDDKGKARRILRSKPPKIVENPEEIRAYLEKIDSGEEEEYDQEADYYFITTKEPDNRAIESLKATAFGRSVQPVALTDTEGKDIVDHESKKKADQALAGYIGGAVGHPRARRKQRD